MCVCVCVCVCVCRYESSLMPTENKPLEMSVLKRVKELLAEVDARTAARHITLLDCKVHTRRHTHTHAHKHTHACMHTRTHINTHTHTPQPDTSHCWIHIHTHTHTHTQTHTHTHIDSITTQSSYNIHELNNVT